MRCAGEQPQDGHDIGFDLVDGDLGSLTEHELAGAWHRVRCARWPGTPLAFPPAACLPTTLP